MPALQMEKKETKYLVGNYEFDTEKEYKKALEEKEIISQLSKQLDLNDAELVVDTYTRMVKEKTFQTVIGLDYLIKLRSLIVKRKYAEPKAVMPLPAADFRPNKADGFLLNEAEKRIANINNERKKDREKFKSAMILNAILVVVIIVMIYIASTSDHINIINYETKILNKYSTWQAQLQEKEDYLNELQKQLQK